MGWGVFIFYFGGFFGLVLFAHWFYFDLLLLFSCLIKGKFLAGFFQGGFSYEETVNIF